MKHYLNIPQGDLVFKAKPSDNVFIATNFEFHWHCMQKSKAILISKMKRFTDMIIAETFAFLVIFLSLSMEIEDAEYHIIAS